MNAISYSTQASIPHRPYDIHPDDMPKQYAIVIDGSNDIPGMAEGVKQVFSTVIPPATGDIVALWLKPGVIHNSGNQVVAFRLIKPAPAWAKFHWNYNPGCTSDPKVVVETLRNPKRQLSFRVNDLSAIHTWVAPLPANRETFKYIPHQQEREANKETIAVTSKVPTEQTELSLLAPTVDGPLTMSSREIAELTEKQHAHVLRDIRVLLDTVLPGWEKDDPKLEHQGISITYDNRGYVSEIRLPKDLTITLVAGYDANLRLKIVRRWMELEGAQPKKETAPQFPIPQTFAEALMLAANQAAQIEHQKERIVEMAPKAEFHDDVASAVNAQDFMSVAKAFGTGRTRFTNWLKARKFIMENRHPYQQFADSGYFRVIEKKRKDRDTGEKFTYTQTLITGKGFTYLQRKWAEDHKGEAA